MIIFQNILHKCKEKILLLDKIEAKKTNNSF